MPTTVLRVTVSAIPSNLPTYDRHDWKHWTDADGDCQDARQEVLVAESRIGPGFRTDRKCRVETGQWLAPYSNAVVTDPGKLDIDHMVPLGNAHLSGAWAWSAQQKERYANHLADPQHLIAVTASANRSKGARGPEDWKPEDRSYWCRYAVDWFTIKGDSGLGDAAGIRRSRRNAQHLQRPTLPLSLSRQHPRSASAYRYARTECGRHSGDA